MGTWSQNHVYDFVADIVRRGIGLTQYILDGISLRNLLEEDLTES
jgi:hypothetical protein